MPDLRSCDGSPARDAPDKTVTALQGRKIAARYRKNFALPTGSLSMGKREEWVTGADPPVVSPTSAAVIRKTLQLGVPLAWRSSKDGQIVCYRAGHIICYAHAVMSQLSMESGRSILHESLRYQTRKRLGSTIEKAQAEQWRF